MNSRHLASERLSILLLAAWLGVYCGAAGQPGGQARAGGFNFWNPIYFYDTEQRAGVGFPDIVIPDDGTELWIEDDLYRGTSMSYGIVTLPYSTGTPVIFRSWWPPVGCIAGYNAIGAIAPTFLLPTEASRVPYGIYSEPSEGENIVIVYIEAYVADTESAPSVSVAWANTGSYTWNRPITIWADYEEGNA
ncbi:hypothetical protein HZA57_09380, partial [Candidatus Poribacteria bacterium]|nr:hypothetical protein [Candidatus Poribacteria bacterium]